MHDAAEYTRRRKAALAVMNGGVVHADGTVRDGQTYTVPFFLKDSSDSATHPRLEVTDADIFDAVENDPKVHHALGMADSNDPRVVADAAQNLSAIARGYAGRLMSVTDEAERAKLKRAVEVLSFRANTILARTL